MQVTQAHIGKAVRWHNWPKGMYFVVHRVSGHRIYGNTFCSPYNNNERQWHNSPTVADWELCDDQDNHVYSLKPVTGKRKVAV